MGLGLMASSTGASRQLMNVLHRCCFSLSYSSISSIISSLADRSIEQAQAVASGPHGLAYDNINISTSIFVEQRPGAMNKVQSGTFAVIYKLLDARHEDMKLEPMLERFRNSSPLQMTDLKPGIKSGRSFSSQTLINIANILFKHVEEFSDALRTHPLLQHPPRRVLPIGHKTEFYPLRATTIEEASIHGNLLVHDDTYLVQLKRDPETLNELAIPSINDQLTNARNRGARTSRALDVDSWERREIFQLAPGVFHLVMNLIWALLHIHRGNLHQHGSLSHLFAVLEKVRLGADRPDYHTLLAALMQILHGFILNAWRAEIHIQFGGSLHDFAKSNPSAQEILASAREIVKKYATPIEVAKPIKKRASEIEDDQGDTVNENVKLLTRDLLYVAELVDAIASGDFGRIEDILPDIACIFRGAGSNNYSTEILHFLHNIKEVWTPQFACVHLIS
jgi:hypothetical protein